MAVGELLLPSLLPVLFQRLASQDLLNLAAQERVRSKLKKWEKKLKMIQSVLNDAEEKQLADKAVKEWLDNLQDLAYDAEDVLDEFSTEIFRRKLMAECQASTSKAQNLIPACFVNFTPSAIKFDVSMRSKIKQITSRLEELCKERDELGLQIISGGSSTIVSARPTRQMSTSVPTEPAIYGRDEDKARILEMVLSNEPSDANFRVIAIVGMGGIGKTTLAREVYNDVAVDDFKFDIKEWICVSENFDVLKISKALLESITSPSCSPNDLNQVQVQLKKAVNGRKILLVLDDVWNKNYGLWENLKAPFLASAPGSKLIVTTRDADVAFTMGSIEHYNLKLLSDDDCWSLFVKHALENRDDIDAHQISSSIQKKVIEKCKGLPLAARTLGGLLRSKRRHGDWEDVLNSKIWDLNEEESDILPVLKLSYCHLPSYLKRCFAYCAIFPKGYEFEEKEVVLLWMAEDIIQQSTNYKQLKDLDGDFIQQPTNHKQLKDLGSEYFHELFSRSFFQKSSSKHNTFKFIMHDLINDLAQWASRFASFRLEEANKQRIKFESVRHASYISDYFNGKYKFEVFNEFKNLRTFLPLLMSNSMSDHYITNMVLSHLLPKFKKLRVLSLKHYYIFQLPNSIGDLIHLRYINFSKTMIRSLPESINSLFNLQTLILTNCSRLKKLPSKMGNLINLNHLDIKNVKLLEEMPLGMKNLKYLHTLSNFIVGSSNGSSLADLNNLKFLHGELCISKLENVIDSQDLIREAILNDKRDLEVLLLEWGSQFEESRNEVVEENVLTMLQPHTNLKELTITNYGGARFSSWLGDPSFSKMVVLTLENCERCKFLPSIGELESLKNLSVKGMASLKNLGFEFYGNLKPFRSLESLQFENLKEWECWEPIRENEHVPKFPRLRELSIMRCPKLTGKLPDYLPSLETLVISECSELVVSFSRLSMLSKLEINECKWKVCSSSLMELKALTDMTLSKVSKMESWLKLGFHNVEFLRIVKCEELICSWQNMTCVEKPLHGIQSFTSLKELSIESCKSLEVFPDVNFLPNLSCLKIMSCKALKSLLKGVKINTASLETLEISNCDSLTSIVRGILPSKIKYLTVFNCKKLQCLVDDKDDSCGFSSSSSALVTHKEISNISLLEILNISMCPSLACITTGGQLPVSLKSLYISCCPMLESIAEKFDNRMCLTHIAICDCEKLKSIPDGLHHLSCLQRITMYGCSSVVSLPEGGLPNNINLSVRISSCENLQALPECLFNYDLFPLRIIKCPSIISFPEGGLPANLTSLTIDGNLKIYKPLIKWGLHNFTSLRSLSIQNCPDAVSFPEEEMRMTLPTSLSHLMIISFSNLKYLSSTGFQRLTSLHYLWIQNCPELTSFPEVGLPRSLPQLNIWDCPLLRRQCKRDKGKEWSKIAHIPCVYIDGKFIYDTEEEE